MGRSKNVEWWWTRLLPLLIWIILILWIASRPKPVLFPADVKTLFGMPREWLQYPYHFSAFFILAILFRRCLSASSKFLSGYKPLIVSLVGCALVSFGSEGIQFYVPTRTPAVRDLVLDQSGAILALTLMRRFSDKIFRLGN